MRIYLLIIATSIFSFLSAQSNFQWEQIELANEANVQVVFITSEGNLYGLDEIDKSLYYSTNQGEEWNLILHDEESKFTISKHFIKEHNNECYIAIEKKFYRHKWETNEIQEIVELRVGLIVDFAILQNETILIKGYISAYLYDLSNELLERKNFTSIPSRRTQIIISNETNYFVYPFGRLQEFSDDLNYTGERITIPAFESMVERQGVLYTESMYSSDRGITWTEHFWGFDMITIDNNGSIYGIKDGVLLKSNDGGQLWNTVGIYSRQIDNLEVNRRLITNNGLTLFADIINTNAIATYLDEAQRQRIDINVGLKKYHSKFVRAGMNENLVSFTNDDDLYDYKTNESSPWSTNEGLATSYLSDVVALPNGEWIRSNWRDISNSNNQGDSWEFISRLGNEILTIKNDLVYLYGPRAKMFSNDLGQSWRSLPSGYFSKESVVTANHEVIFGESNFKDGMKIYDMNDDFSRDLLYQGMEITNTIVGTSYTGSTIYTVNYSSHSMLISDDGGDNFSELEVPFNALEMTSIFIDHNNNVFVYNNHDLYVSQDEGQNWIDITPSTNDLSKITDLTVSFDDIIYISTFGAGILKTPLSIINSNVEFEVADITVLPNPATTSINFNLDQNFSNGNWIIHDVSGRQIKEGIINSQKLEIDVSQMKEGLYFIKFLGDNINGSTRFVKM